MITFRFAADPAESIAFSYSPVVEAVLSLHVLTEPKHHPLQHPWVRRARDFPAALKREIAAFGFAYRGFIPEFLVPSPDTVYATFEDELGRPRAAGRPDRRPRVLASAVGPPR